MLELVIENVTVKGFVELDELDSNDEVIVCPIVEKDNARYAIKLSDFKLEKKEDYYELLFNTKAYEVSEENKLGELVEEENLPFDLDKVSVAIVEKLIEMLKRELSNG